MTVHYGARARLGVRAEGCMRRWVDLGTVRALAILVCLGLVGTAAAQDAEPMRLISSGSNGRPTNGASGGVGTNESGSTVVFYSDASNLVPSDTNGMRDVFVRDAGSATIERISVSSAGAQANRASHAQGGNVAVSGDGAIVAFYSAATNLVAGDTNRASDIFVRDRSAGVTQLISVASDGTPGNGPSFWPSISADGRLVAFQSEASNLVPDDTNNLSDIFVHDRVSGVTIRACRTQGNGASSNPAISRDGRFVAFASYATNLVAGDTNGKVDIFVCDLASGVAERVSVDSKGAQGNGDSILPALSADGNIVGFKSLADNLVPGDRNNVVDVFVFDRTSRRTERISVSITGGNADDFSFPPSLSDDGRFVAFGSAATNLVSNDANHVSDVFVRDRQIGRTLMVDVNDFKEPANGGTPDAPPAISGDGKRVAFASAATNLVAEDRDTAVDIYVGQNPYFGENACPFGVCSGSKVCVDGFCVDPSPSPTVTKTPTPTKTRTPTLTPTPTPTFRMCVDDSDCAPDEHCRAGYCKKKRECDDNDPAIDRLNCIEREACIDGLCECGGDCNLDGYVFGNEVTNAVYILGGLLGLPQCASADMNGDGEVKGTEVTMAVLNLARGCAQEGKPMIFAHDRGEIVTLTLDASKTGDDVTVSVGASGGSGEIATVQLDLLFDPSIVDIGDPSTHCRLDPRLRGTHMLLATLPASPAAPDGLRRLRLFTGDLSDPIATFADGPVMSCTFRVTTPISVETTFGADRLDVGDNRAFTFGSRVVSGGVSLVIPTAVPAPTPAVVCAGDCDGDGEVLGSEITTVVQMMAGLVPIADCPAGDADRDGEVTVTDVTRAVLSLGRGCAR